MDISWVRMQVGVIGDQVLLSTARRLRGVTSSKVGVPGGAHVDAFSQVDVVDMSPQRTSHGEGLVTEIAQMLFA